MKTINIRLSTVDEVVHREIVKARKTRNDLQALVVSLILEEHARRRRV